MTDTPAFKVDLKATLGSLELQVELEIGAETLLVVGPNGSGKSSLLKLLLGAEPPSQGTVTLGGRTLTDTNHNVRVPVEERHIGYVPQDYGLFPHMTVEAHLAFALGSLPRVKHPGAGAAQARIESTLEQLDLTRHRKSHPRQLSGGERQRLALARALVAAPSALLLDEPLAALDSLHRSEVRAFLSDYLKQLALPTLLVTHDQTDARFFQCRVAVLEQGRLVQIGHFAELQAAPATAFVAHFTRAD